MGDVVVEFNEEQAREVTNQLAQQDVDAVAINFLWSFLNDDHASVGWSQSYERSWTMTSL